MKLGPMNILNTIKMKCESMRVLNTKKLKVGSIKILKKEAWTNKNFKQN